MIQCPNCQQPVEILDKHIGALFTCPHCAAVFFVNYDGQPEMASHEAEPAQEQNENAFVPPISETHYGTPAAEEFSPAQDQYLEPTEEPQFQQPADSFGEYSAESSDGGFNETPLNEQYSEELSEAATESEPAYEMNTSENFDYSENLNQPAEPIVENRTSDDANFADVIDFANANSTAGNFSYAVIIEGIDSSQLVYQLKEAMTDSKFGWDVSELLTHIGGGRLVVKGLSPAKASVFINRIKYLPFKVSWRQDVLSGS
ncbi:zf-TFIIB domain-containing protein [Bdellovibrio sp. KM01]|uniref:TFIIB-type zinc ribbon-containing protein n=1 Tax=Bdellovibrio sp. KM01 TaxID=2748865 RepID=UPI0015EA1A2B|nr:zf-TFIIB domain-containing protein [Bdellovibrio sp. KM01]QLY25718.1 hypothetical protein HW988_01320 [Bdellovibrio sp. KM01]